METEIERLRREYALMERSCKEAHDLWMECMEKCGQRLQMIAQLEAELFALRGR